MRRVVALYRSSVGKKILMAVSGFIWFGFLLGHMAGNLKAFQGAEHFNEYAHFLREIGSPLVPEYSLLWLARIVLVAALAVHVVMAIQTWRQSAEARRGGYQKEDDLSFSWASRTMRWGGVIILLFIVYHILHFTTGTVHPAFQVDAQGRALAYENLVTGFSGQPLVVAFYAVALAAICFHLWHGVWSMMQTLGANHPKYKQLRRPAAVAFALVVFFGFIAVPISVVTGILSL